MKQFETPLEITNIISRHIPKRISSFLEPAVGHGRLLEPVTNRLYSAKNKIVCIDVDKHSLKFVEKKFRPIFGKSLNIFHGDFLHWAELAKSNKNSYFDCIIMNPPFFGRSNGHVKIDLDRELFCQDTKTVVIPIEQAFIIKALRILAPGGRLFAIVPPSVVASPKTFWIRKYMMQTGAIHYVYEFPKFTFNKVESRIYLVIFEKAIKQKNVILCNNNSTKSNPLSLSNKDLCDDLRLDYRFCIAHQRYKILIRHYKNLGWTRLGDIASVYRGSVKSPLGARKAVHTCNYQKGFWCRDNQRNDLIKDKSEKSIREKDILVKRVGRFCARSFGTIIGLKGYTCSDCLLIIRPKNKNMSVRILLALRFLLASKQGAPLLERGTGATYLSERSLSNLFIPLDISKKNPKLYNKYVRLINDKQGKDLNTIENKLRSIYTIR